MAEYWPSSFSACLWTETESRFLNSPKKERGQYPAILTEKKSLSSVNKRFIIWLSGTFFSLDTAGSPEQVR